jgi:hypothetical protein
MSKLIKAITTVVAGVATSAMIMTAASAAVTLKIQSATPLTADEAVMLAAFTKDVEDLT